MPWRTSPLHSKWMLADYKLTILGNLTSSNCIPEAAQIWGDALIYILFTIQVNLIEFS